MTTGPSERPNRVRMTAAATRCGAARKRGMAPRCSDDVAAVGSSTSARTSEAASYLVVYIASRRHG